MVLEVKGMVCSMCAFGIQEGLSELSFLNNKKFKADGIEVDLDTQMIYIPIDLSKTIDELEAIKIVKDAGYDTVSIYTNFDGKSIKKKAAPKLVG
jgi:copper chaperone CopZ